MLIKGKQPFPQESAHLESNKYRTSVLPLEVRSYILGIRLIKMTIYGLQHCSCHEIMSR